MNMEQIISHLAKKEGMRVEEVIEAMEQAIAIGRSSPDPVVKALWQSIPCRGEYPTPMELIAYLARCALETEERSHGMRG